MSMNPNYGGVVSQGQRSCALRGAPDSESWDATSSKKVRYFRRAHTRLKN